MKTISILCAAILAGLVFDSTAAPQQRASLQGAAQAPANFGPCGNIMRAPELAAGPRGVVPPLSGLSGTVLAPDAAGNLFIADIGQTVVRRLSPDGAIAIIAG